MTKMSQLKRVDSNGNTTKSPRNRSRKWAFTLNNYSHNDYVSMTQKVNEYKYIIGKEISSTGTKHLQGYLECELQVDLSKMRKTIPKAHFEKAGTKCGDQSKVRYYNIKYCAKDGDYITNFSDEEIQRGLGIKKDEPIMEEPKEVCFNDFGLRKIYNATHKLEKGRKSEKEEAESELRDLYKNYCKANKIHLYKYDSMRWKDYLLYWRGRNWNGVGLGMCNLFDNWWTDGWYNPDE